MSEWLYLSLMEALQVVVVALASLLLIGWVRMLKCWLQNRSSASMLQPYRDIYKLFFKDIVLAHNASWIFRFTPYLVFGAVLLTGAIIPVLSAELPLARTADVIALVSIFAMIRFFIALAGMDIGTAFGGMGSSREMMIASLAEPALLISIFTVSFVTGSTSLSEMVHTTTGGHIVLRPSLAFALLAFIIILIAETGRIPIDNPATHLELTMVHEAMILEYSGRHLALIEWAGMMKFFLYSSLGIALFFPWGMAKGAGALPLAMLSITIKTGFGAIVIVLIETGLAKMRLFRVPEFLGSAFLLSSLCILSYFMLE
ncbi:MAG: NADH-quinone oxidoreductase subunit H [Deltaproteobacteria bacterium]|nr:NADH-quinone oxidoreductase subunit H [Deltaproteobacteria bacterium]